MYFRMAECSPVCSLENRDTITLCYYNHTTGMQGKHQEAKHQLELERQATVMQEQEKTDAVMGELESTKQVWIVWPCMN